MVATTISVIDKDTVIGLKECFVLPNLYANNNIVGLPIEASNSLQTLA